MESAEPSWTPPPVGQDPDDGDCESPGPIGDLRDTTMAEGCGDSNDGHECMGTRIENKVLDPVLNFAHDLYNIGQGVDDIVVPDSVHPVAGDPLDPYCSFSDMAETADDLLYPGDDQGLIETGADLLGKLWPD